jgi:hypothetical protein
MYFLTAIILIVSRSYFFTLKNCGMLKNGNVGGLDLLCASGAGEERRHAHRLSIHHWDGIKYGIDHGRRHACRHLGTRRVRWQRLNRMEKSRFLNVSFSGEACRCRYLLCKCIPYRFCTFKKN